MMAWILFCLLIVAAAVVIRQRHLIADYQFVLADLEHAVNRKDKRIVDQSFDLFRRNNEIAELKQRLEAIELLCDPQIPMEPA